jgi:hypothetical protein
MPQEKMTMDQVRERFPEYDDMDDMTLANAIHGRFYSDIPLADFYAQVGFNPEQDAGDNGVYPDTGPGSSPTNPIDLATVDRATAAGMKRGMWVKGPDGTVYALPSDPVEGQFRVGDMPQAPGVNVRPQSGVEDFAKSLPTGVVEGLTGLAGMQGTIGQMIYGEQSLGQNMPGFGIVGPTGEQLNETIRQGLGRDYYQPQTVAGEYSRTFGEFLPGALAPGSALARGASVAVPAFTSETAGQIARGMSGGERDTNAENFARLLGGLGGGFAVGGVGAVRGGADISLRNAAEGVTPQNLQLATALRRDAEAMGIDLTNAEAIQQVTGGGSGLGRLQRVVEGQTTRMAPMFANRPAQVQGAIEARLNQIAPSVEPSTLAPQVREAAGGVLNRLRQRANEDARPFYDRLPGQSLPPEQFQQLAENPSFAAALRAVRADEELAPLLRGPNEDLSTINEVVKQLGTMADEAAPSSMRIGGSMTRSSQRTEAQRLADALAREASPDYGMARDTVRGINEAFIDPLKAGPIGALADTSEAAPNLAAMTGRLFPDAPFEGQAAETARALELMGEIDPSVGGPLVRQQLARQAMEAQQDLATGSNQFGGANFAARAFGNPEQRRTVMGALDVVNRPDSNMAFPPLSANAMPARGSDPMAQLVEVLQTTGQRHRAGSDTAFNQDIQRQMAGGNVASGAVRSVANIPGIPGRIATGIDDIVARRNAETLADLLMANSEDFNARLTRALNRPRGANRVRAGVAVAAGQED